MKHVLIVEDEQFLVVALRDNLEADGYSVDVAKNGEEVKKHISDHRPDLILLDLLMPKRDGFYVLEDLKKSPETRGIPVIVLSNLGNDAIIKLTQETGADDYFTKSDHTLVEVVERAKEYLEGKRTSKVALAGDPTVPV